MLIEDRADRQLSLHAEAPNIIRVRYGLLDNISRPMYHLVSGNSDTPIDVSEDAETVNLKTAQLSVIYNKTDKLLRFTDRKTGEVYLEEEVRQVKPFTRFGEKTFECTQQFKTDPSEFISGTGFQQDNMVNYNGRYAYMVQWNTSGVVPFFQSTKKWAILWNNTSLTELNPDPVLLPLTPLANQEATMEFVAEETGPYHFSLRRKTDEKFGKLQFTVGDQILFSKRPAWDPMVFTGVATLEAGKSYTLRATGNFKVSYHPPSAREKMVLRSEMGEALDYHFIAGNTADERIAGYRKLTGSAPLFPKWAYGFFQCKERYKTADELLEVLHTFREKKIPMDCMVQDWQYWGKLGWNALRFDEKRFPNMQAVIQEVHDQNAHIMISVWPNFGDPKRGSKDNLKTYGDQGWLMERSEVTAADAPPPQVKHFYSGYLDIMNPDAAQAFWGQMNTNIFQIGMDAWWLDATEPNLDGYQGGLRYYPTHQGPGAYWLNLYPMMHSKNVYEGQRAANPEKRVFILARTPFAGIQKYGTAVWSGDTFADWDTFRRQVVGGITASYSGLPYYCSDIGGFAGLRNDRPAHREMYTRWFQFGAFTPVFRAHGTTSAREPWCFGEESEAIQVEYLKLRYQLLPYIYSAAANITYQNGTLMRGLMMDFPEDPKACESGQSYMFGPAFLVSPVLEEQRKTKPGQIIPTSALFDKAQQPGGLSSAYYNGTNFEELVLEGKDARIDFDWDQRGQAHLEVKVDGNIEGLNDDRFSARWEGFINIQEPGTYTFITAADDGVRLWINGELIIDDWKKKGETINSAPVTLKKTGMMAIKLEYVEHSKAASMELRWQPPGTVQAQDQVWPVYLPEGSTWYNFWTQQTFDGGQTVQTPAPLKTLPLYVKGGSIIPMGPVQEWVDQKPADELEIRIYPGSNGSFSLYEDEGDSYRYEDGAFSTIPFSWNEANRTLKIGSRTGSYPGMLEKRHFQINLMGGETKSVEYTGTEMMLKF